MTYPLTTHAGCGNQPCHNPFSETFTEQPPNCTIAFTDCVGLVESWITVNSAKMSDSNGVLTVDYPSMCWGELVHAFLVLIFHPNTDCNLAATTCGRCTIGAGTVDLYYFAVQSTVSRDLCATTPGPLPPMPTPLATQSVVVNGSTFYADKAYISFQYLDAWISCNGQTTEVGSSRSQSVLGSCCLQRATSPGVS